MFSTGLVNPGFAVIARQSGFLNFNARVGEREDFAKGVGAHENATCFDELVERSEGIKTTEARSLLARFGFRGDDAYKIIKDLYPYVALSESTLYTILKRLEGAEMLTVRTAEHDGRLRKYYRITRKGTARIEEFKKEWKEIISIYAFVTKEDHHD